MREFDEQSITAAVVERFQGTPDPRLKAVMTSLVRHLHDFVRDVELTFDEWSYAIDFLTRTGQIAAPPGRSSFSSRTPWVSPCW